MWHVYIVECSDKTLYTGIARNLEKRLIEHNESARGAKYTKARRPVRLVYFEKLKSRSEALREEFRIKKIKRSAKCALLEKFMKSF